MKEMHLFTQILFEDVVTMPRISTTFCGEGGLAPAVLSSMLIGICWGLGGVGRWVCGLSEVVFLLVSCPPEI